MHGHIALQKEGLAGYQLQHFNPFNKLLLRQACDTSKAHNSSAFLCFAQHSLSKRPSALGFSCSHSHRPHRQAVVSEGRHDSSIAQLAASSRPEDGRSLCQHQQSSSRYGSSCLHILECQDCNNSEINQERAWSRRQQLLGGLVAAFTLQSQHALASDQELAKTQAEYDQSAGNIVFPNLSLCEQPHSES